MQLTQEHGGGRPVASLTDEELMWGVREGDLAALGELERRYRPLVEEVTAAFGGRQRAERLADEAFRRVYDRRHQYRPGREVAGWLFAFARHVALTTDSGGRSVA